MVVLQRPGRLGLSLEAVQDVAPLGQIAAQELDREPASDDGVLRLVDDPHPAPGEQPDDPVLATNEPADGAGVWVGAHGAFSGSLRRASRSTDCPSIRR